MRWQKGGRTGPLVGIAYVAAVEAILWALRQQSLLLARVVEFAGLAVLIAATLLLRSAQDGVPKEVPGRKPDVVVAATGVIVVVPFILAVGWPWYLFLALPTGLNGTDAVLAGILAGAFVAAGVYYALVLAIAQIWLTDSGAVVRSPFAPRLMVVHVPIGTCSKIHIRGRRIWWGAPTKAITSFFLWTPPRKFRQRVAQLHTYEIVEDVRHR